MDSRDPDSKVTGNRAETLTLKRIALSFRTLGGDDFFNRAAANATPCIDTASTLLSSTGGPDGDRTAVLARYPGVPRQ